MKNCGPKGYPGMAEVGNMGLPAKILKKGITDMVRISDARMSGTAFGTVVLHVAPEAMEFGPLAAVQDGDMITLDAEKGLLHLEVSDAEIASRIEELKKHPPFIATGGYLEIYRKHVLQADEGCDFDFLVGCRGAEVPAHSH
jgi:L-arabonate dehydrase